MHARRTTRGFTLVELLVVLAIICLLMAVMLPALNRAREAGRTAACLPNLRSIVLAESMYADANNERLTPCDYRSTAWNGPNLTWAGNLVGNGYINAPIASETTAAHTKPLNRPSPFRCPSGLVDDFTSGCPTSRRDPEGARPYTSGIWDPSTHRVPSNRLIDVWYGCNASSGSYDFPMWRVASDNDIDNWTTYPKRTLLQRPGSTVAFFDGCTLCNWTNVSGNRISARHNGGTVTNLVFWDSHAESAPSRKMPGGNWSASVLNTLASEYVWKLSQAP